MAYAVTPCGQKMTVTQFVRHIPKCTTCLIWWGRSNVRKP